MHLKCLNICRLISQTPQDIYIELPCMTQDLWEVSEVASGEQARYPRVSEMHLRPSFKHLNYSVQSFSAPKR